MFECCTINIMQEKCILINPSLLFIIIIIINTLE